MNSTFTTLSVFVLTSLLALAACTPAASGEQQAATPQDTVAAVPQGFQVTVLNDTIDSPLKQLKGSIENLVLTLTYGSPSVKGRVIWGDLVPYQEVWRSGANEATTFEVSADVMIGEQRLPAGKYALFTIPGEQDWTLIFNTVADQWGAYQYDETKDALRVKVMPETSETASETLEFSVENGNTVILSWEKIRVPFTVSPA